MDVSRIASISIGFFNILIGAIIFYASLFVLQDDVQGDIEDRIWFLNGAVFLLLVSAFTFCLFSLTANDKFIAGGIIDFIVIYRLRLSLKSTMAIDLIEHQKKRVSQMQKIALLLFANAIVFGVTVFILFPPK